MFGVSKFVAKQRAIQLGLDAAAGTMIYIDGHYHSPFSFTEGILGQKQTFVIDKDSLDGLCREDKVLSDLIVSGQFIYLGYVVCINDKQYVEKKDPKWMSPGECEYDLTEYARDHVDECCLIFDWDSISGKNDDGGFYGLCYLSKDVSAQNRIEHTYNPDFECNQDTMALAKQIAKYKAAFAAEEKVLRELPRTFPDQLIYHMDRKNITVEALAFQSNLSTTTIQTPTVSAMRHTRRQWISWRDGRSTQPSIRSSTEPDRKRTGQTRRCGRKRIHPWVKPSAWIRSKPPAIPQGRTPARRTPSGS